MILNRRINHFLLTHLQEVVEQFFTTKEKSDRLLRAYFRKHRIGKRDRGWLSDRFYMFMRHRYLFEYIGENCDVSAYEAVAEFCAGWVSAPSEKEYETLWKEGQFASLFHSFPDWFIKKITDSYGEKTASVLAWLDQKASVTVRANRKQMSRTLLLRELKNESDCRIEQTPLSPDGLILHGETQRLSESSLFENGCFEFQDESSQLTAYLVNPASKTLLDACAGGGGKSVAILNAFPKIDLTASDVRTSLFSEITKRAKRAGHQLKTVKPHALTGRYDTIFLDMPCSGSGVLRRNPEDRWRITPQRIEELSELQKSILTTHAKKVALGGEIVYITCSLFRDENESVIEDFLEKNSDFTLVSVAERLRENDIASTDEVCDGQYFRIQAGWDRDIFFGAILKKKG